MKTIILSSKMQTLAENLGKRQCLEWLFVVATLFASFHGRVTAFATGSSRKTTQMFLSRQYRNSMEEMVHKANRTDTIIRGSNYLKNDSSVPPADLVASHVGVQPLTNASAAQWKRAFVWHRRMLPILHLLDKNHPPNSSLSLMCLWWKALAGNDPDSPAFDNRLSYDLLPSATRWIVCRRIRRWYPRLHHANVELRTAYLDQTLQKTINKARKNETVQCIRLVSLGAGYDTRSIKFMERNLVDEAFELDLPSVVEAKQSMLTSKRFQRRRPNIRLPTMRELDLNDVDKVQRTLDEILQGAQQRSHTIFLFEGVMIYLNETVPTRLLQTCRQVLDQHKETTSGTLLFADRLENIPGGDENIAKQELQKLGWQLVDWEPKPGLARHMGCAIPIGSNP